MYDPRKVVSYGFPLDDDTFTYNISGAVTQDDVGKAVSIDTAAASTMKLAADGAQIVGRLSTYEDRSQQGAGKTGSVQRRFKEKLKAVAGHTIVVGDSVVGAGGGLVKDAGAGVSNRTLCVEVLADDYVVIELL